MLTETESDLGEELGKDDLISIMENNIKNSNSLKNINIHIDFLKLIVPYTDPAI